MQKTIYLWKIIIIYQFPFNSKQNQNIQTKIFTWTGGELDEHYENDHDPLPNHDLPLSDNEEDDENKKDGIAISVTNDLILKQLESEK